MVDVAPTARSPSRRPRVPVALAVFVGLNLILAVALGKSSAPQGWLIAAMFLHGGDYVGRVIGSHLLRRPNVWPDFAAPVLAARPAAEPDPLEPVLEPVMEPALAMVRAALKTP